MNLIHGLVRHLLRQVIIMSQHARKARVIVRMVYKVAKQPYFCRDYILRAAPSIIVFLVNLIQKKRAPREFVLLVTDDHRTTPQTWTNGPGGNSVTVMLTCVADTLWYLSGIVISDETVSSLKQWL